MIQPSKGGGDGLMVMLIVLVTFHLVQFEYGIFGNLSALHPVELGQNSTEARYRLMLPNLLLYSVSTEQDSLRRVILPLPGSDYELYSYEPLQHYEWHQAKTTSGPKMHSLRSTGMAKTLGEMAWMAWMHHCPAADWPGWLRGHLRRQNLLYKRQPG